MSEIVRAVDERGDPTGSTLVFAPGVSARADEVCAELLSGADVALVLALRQPPEDWRATRENTPPSWFVTTDPHPDSVRTVSDPADLTGLGIAVAEFLDELPADAEPAVCLDSVTTLFQYVEPERAFRFLQVLSGRVLAADGTVHCHVDPAAHDDRTVERLGSLFDGAITVDHD